EVAAYAVGVGDDLFGPDVLRSEDSLHAGARADGDLQVEVIQGDKGIKRAGDLAASRDDGENAQSQELALVERAERDGGAVAETFDERALGRAEVEVGGDCVGHSEGGASTAACPQKEFR